MKMKKIFSGILATIMICCCFLFTSCDPETKEEKRLREAQEELEAAKKAQKKAYSNLNDLYDGIEKYNYYQGILN